jgi:hypothetical protein
MNPFHQYYSYSMVDLTDHASEINHNGVPPNGMHVEGKKKKKLEGSKPDMHQTPDLTKPR